MRYFKSVLYFFNEAIKKYFSHFDTYNKTKSSANAAEQDTNMNKDKIQKKNDFLRN